LRDLRPDEIVFDDRVREILDCARGGSLMLQAVEGIYRDGKVELLELPAGVTEARVVVTFLPANGPIDLRARGISEPEAAELRWRLGAAAEDWDRPEMGVYDDM
jgi:hypothetical protein